MTNVINKLPEVAFAELGKILAYNDSCTSINARVTRKETISLLNQYGWYGSASSLNRLLLSRFKRVFTGSK